MGRCAITGPGKVRSKLSEETFAGVPSSDALAPKAAVPRRDQSVWLLHQKRPRDVYWPKGKGSIMALLRLSVWPVRAARWWPSIRDALIIIPLLAYSSQGRAESTALGLIDSFKIKTEKIDSDSERCGVTEENLLGVVKTALSGTGLSVVHSKSESDVVLDISPMTIILDENTCVTAYELDLLTFPVALFRGTAGPQPVLLWSHSGIFASTMQDHMARMREALQN